MTVSVHPEWETVDDHGLGDIVLIHAVESVSQRERDNKMFGGTV